MSDEGVLTVNDLEEAMMRAAGNYGRPDSLYVTRALLEGMQELAVVGQFLRFMDKLVPQSRDR